MDAAFALLKLRLEWARRVEAVGPAVAKYARTRGPAASDADACWRRFERRCETLQALAPPPWQGAISAQVLAGLAPRAAAGKDGLTPLGLSLRHGCQRLGQRLLQGGASPCRLWSHRSTPENQLWHAWEAQSAWAVAWLVGQGAQVLSRLVEAVLAGTRPHMGLPILWGQKEHLSTEDVLRRLGLDTTQVTFLAEPVTDIPLDALFISQKRQVFDVRELLRYVVARRRFSNPFGGMLSPDEVALLCAHPAAAPFNLTPRGVPQPPLQVATVQALFALASGLCAGWDGSDTRLVVKGWRVKSVYDPRPTNAPAKALGTFAAFRDTLSPMERCALDGQEVDYELLPALLHSVANNGACVKYTGYRIYRLACDHVPAENATLYDAYRDARRRTMSARGHMR